MNLRKRASAWLLATAVAVSLLPATALATSVGQGVLGGQPSGGAGVTDSRYNTVKDLNPDESMFATNKADQVQGDTRWRQQDSTRLMYEYYDHVLIIHGYGSVVGDADAIAISEQTPGTIGGNVIGAHRKSWLDGFYPYLHNGKTNGPPRTRTVRKQVTDASGNVRVETTTEEVKLYETSVPIHASDIQYIIIDDKVTATQGNMGLSQDDVHDSYDMFEDQYDSGITDIAPYAFARLPNLKAIDFDSSQIRSIGAYAFAGCEQLGTESMDGFSRSISYTNVKVYDPETKKLGTQRNIYNHDYIPGGCGDECKGATNGDCKHADANEKRCHEERAGRIVLPHGIQTIGEHAFQNCPNIQEFVVHEDNPYFVASCREASAWEAYKGDYKLYTNGVIYSNNEASKDGIKETGYTRLRSAVMSDYANVPNQYKGFWRGPFGETEPMPLEWYVRSWDPGKYTEKVLGVSPPPYEHCSWTAIETAVDKAKAVSGHVGDGNTVVTENDDWKTTWTTYLAELVNEDPARTYDKNWWNDDYFNSGRYPIGYDRKAYGNSIAGEPKTTFDNYMKDNDALHNFQTLFLHPEGHPDTNFRIFPGQDPAEWDDAVDSANKNNDMACPVAVIAPFAFANSANMSTIDMTICDSLTTFGQGTFLNCAGLTTVIFPECGFTDNGTPDPSDSGRKPNYQLTKLADDMFSQCRALNTIQNLDRDRGETLGLSNAEYMDHHAPQDGTLTHYSTVQEFGQNCFHKCLSLSLGSFDGGHFPDSLLIIGQSAFHTCKRLTSVEVHKNIEIIGDYAFSDCYNLSEVTFEDKNDPPAHGGPVQDRIKDHRNGTSENKGRQFYISGEFSEPKIKMALQFGNKTFEHCSSLSHLRLGSDWLVQPTTFENAIYILRIECQTPHGEKTIHGYDFKNGTTGQSGGNPDRVGEAYPADESFFTDCAYKNGLRKSGTTWIERT